jgi:hypothetical protein
MTSEPFSGGEPRESSPRRRLDGHLVLGHHEGERPTDRSEVVDDQDAGRRGRVRFARVDGAGKQGRRRDAHRPRGLGHREDHPERRSQARLAVDVDAPAMVGDDSGKRTESPSPVPSPTGLGGEERVEDGWGMASAAIAPAGVRHPHDDRGAGRVRHVERRISLLSRAPSGIDCAALRIRFSKTWPMADRTPNTAGTRRSVFGSWPRCSTWWRAITSDSSTTSFRENLPRRASGLSGQLLQIPDDVTDAIDADPAFVEQLRQLAERRVSLAVGLTGMEKAAERARHRLQVHRHAGEGIVYLVADAGSQAPERREPLRLLEPLPQPVCAPVAQGSC